MKISPQNIYKEISINRSIDKCWWQWSCHEGLLTFFGEDNLIKLAIGGTFEIYFSKQEPEGLRGSEGCKILSFVPKRQLTFSWNAPPSFPDIRNADHYTWVTLNFQRLDNEHCKLSLTHAGWPEDGSWQAVYEYFDQAWDKVFQGFEKANI